MDRADIQGIDRELFDDVIGKTVPAGEPRIVDGDCLRIRRRRPLETRPPARAPPSAGRARNCPFPRSSELPAIPSGCVPPMSCRNAATHDEDEARRVYGRSRTAPRRPRSGIEGGTLRRCGRACARPLRPRTPAAPGAPAPPRRTGGRHRRSARHRPIPLRVRSPERPAPDSPHSDGRAGLRGPRYGSIESSEPAAPTSADRSHTGCHRARCPDRRPLPPRRAVPDCARCRRGCTKIADPAARFVWPADRGRSHARADPKPSKHKPGHREHRHCPLPAPRRAPRPARHHRGVRA